MKGDSPIWLMGADQSFPLATKPDELRAANPDDAELKSALETLAREGRAPLWGFAIIKERKAQ